MVTVKTQDQLNKLKNAKIFPKLDIPIATRIAWTNQFTYGKLWAPELQRDSLDEILVMFESQNVIQVRKLIQDPNRIDTPLYVFTFLGPAPTKLRLGYQNLNIDKYYPSPLQCRSCYRFGHPTKQCRSKPTCMNCGSTEHTKDQCNSNELKCINCKGTHDSCNKNCPSYIFEKEICTLTADKGISFNEARALHRGNTSNQTQNNNRESIPRIIQETPDLCSPRQFPFLQQKSQRQRYNQIPNLGQTKQNQQSDMQLPQQSQSIINNNEFLESQYNDYPPPGQRTGTMRNSPQNINHSPLYLPNSYPSYVNSLNTAPYSQQNVIPDRQPNIERLTQNQYSQEEPTTYSNSPQSANVGEQFSLNHIMKNLPEIITLVIKIIFTTELTDRIECITKIAHLFKLDRLVTATLSSMQIHSNDV